MLATGRHCRCQSQCCHELAVCVWLLSIPYLPPISSWVSRQGLCNLNVVSAADLDKENTTTMGRLFRAKHPPILEPRERKREALIINKVRKYL